jgi:hypothetical protein
MAAIYTFDHGPEGSCHLVLSCAIRSVIMMIEDTIGANDCN